MTEIITFTITGIVFGLTAGISPGPLLTVVITETLVHSRKEGIKVAIAPLITDIPIILLTIYLLSKLNEYGSILGTISFLGGLFIIYLGIDSFKARDILIDTNGYKPKSIRRGILVNTLSPHPYMFWLTVGVPLLFRAYNISLGTSLAFLISFYVCLVGSKVLIALLVHKSRNYLKNKTYKWIMRILGLVLIGFAIVFILDGFKHFGIL